MTLFISDLKYSILEKLLKVTDTISEDECDIIIQVCIHIISGADTKSEILDNFERPAKLAIHKGKFNKIVDQYKIIKYLIEKITESNNKIEKN